MWIGSLSCFGVFKPVWLRAIRVAATAPCVPLQEQLLIARTMAVCETVLLRARRDADTVHSSFRLSLPGLGHGSDSYLRVIAGRWAVAHTG
jgi:hypothetical protein